MQWTNKGIILKNQHHNDDQFILTIFTEDYGLYKGMASVNSKNRNHLQIGNTIIATWRARLEQHLGFFSFELNKSLSMVILQDKVKIYSIYSLFNTLSDCLPERHQEKALFHLLNQYLEELKFADNWYCSHINYEISMLKELGYGLNFDECAVTGAKKDLIYLSPKTGKAVSLEIGNPYKDKLFLLPKYFSSNIDISTNNKDYLDYQNCLKILNYFVSKFFKLNTHTIDTRERFLNAFEKKFLS